MMMCGAFKCCEDCDRLKSEMYSFNKGFEEYKPDLLDIKALSNSKLEYFTKDEEEIVTPPRYTKGTIEVWDAIVGMDLTYLEGNAVKYIARHEQKGGVEDLKKAIQYIKKIAKVNYQEVI